jgi:hypothetical protein
MHTLGYVTSDIKRIMYSQRYAFTLVTNMRISKLYVWAK